MSLPEEKKRALKRTHEFMRSLLTMRLSDFRKMKKEEFEEWRKEAYYCIKHYPFDVDIDRYFENEVCKECGFSNPFHRFDCGSK